jgi:hypothetical protein
MKPVTVKQWTAALRSGKYEQAQGCLVRGNAYCCLGVLRKISRSSLIAVDLRLDSIDGKRVRWEDISKRVAVKFGKGLPCANDDGTPFAEIADMIEAVTQ